MATYIPGVTDVFPNPVLYKPDWNRIERNLAIADAKYKQGVSRVKTFYNSVFNSPMLGEDNIKRRDEYLQKITESLKNASGLDLSQLSNQAAIMNLMEPVATDIDIAKDINFTMDYRNKLSKAEQLKSSSDPATRKRYSEMGVKALNYMAEDFQKASREQRLSMSLPSYTENVDMMELANKMYKDYGVSVKQDQLTGQYIWSQKNGDIVLPLTESMVANMMNNDPAVKSMLQTQAYVNRRDAVKMNLPKFAGDEAAAERDYLTSTLNTLKTAKEKLLAESETEANKYNIAVANWEKIIKSRGIIEGSDEHKRYLSDVRSQKLAQDAAATNKNMLFDFGNLDMNNINDLRNAVDQLNFRSLYTGMGNEVARFLAFKNAESSLKPNPVEQTIMQQQLMLQREMQMESIRQANRIEVLKKRKELGLDADKDDNNNQRKNWEDLFGEDAFGDDSSKTEDDPDAGDPFEQGVKSYDESSTDEDDESDKEPNTPLR
jgi:hypothetical protein